MLPISWNLSATGYWRSIETYISEGEENKKKIHFGVTFVNLIPDF